MLTVGEKLRLRKPHPCGSTDWEVLKTGVDVRLRCLGCQRILLLPREKLLKQIKKRLDADQTADPQR